MRISDLQNYNVVTAQSQVAPQVAEQEPAQEGDGLLGGIREFGTGIAQSVGSTLVGVGTLGRGIQSFIGGGRGLGGDGIFDPASPEAASARELLEPQTASAKAGNFVGNVAQFAVPSAKAASATVGAGMLTRAAGQGVAAGAVEAAQTGDVDQGTLYTALFGAAMVPAGDALKAASSHLSKSLPRWLVEPLVKQTKRAKEQGKDIVPYMVEKGRIGTVDRLIQQSDDAITAANNSVDDLLGGSTQRVNLYQVAEDVSEQLNRQGAVTTADDVLNTIQRQAFKTERVLTDAALNPADDIAIAKANTVRSQLDEALYKGREALAIGKTENKEILELYTNALREKVKTLEPASREIFNEYAKEITLKRALQSAAASSNGRNALGLMDIIVGGGAFGVTGNPLTALAAAGGRRAFESAPVKTALAATFKNTDKVTAALSTASPAVRGAVLEFISSLEEDTQDTQTQSPTTGQPQ